MMPTAIVFEGEVTGSPSRVPIGGVDNFTERRGEQRVMSLTSLWYLCQPKTSVDLICIWHSNDK